MILSYISLFLFEFLCDIRSQNPGKNTPKVIMIANNESVCILPILDLSIKTNHPMSNQKIISINKNLFSLNIGYLKYPISLIFSFISSVVRFDDISNVVMYGYFNFSLYHSSIVITRSKLSTCILSRSC